MIEKVYLFQGQTHTSKSQCSAMVLIQTNKWQIKTLMLEDNYWQSILNHMKFIDKGLYSYQCLVSIFGTRCSSI